jgi:hypothetical protein
MNLSSDPEWEEMLAEFREDMEAQQAEWPSLEAEARVQEAESARFVESAKAAARESASATPLAEFEKVESTLGFPSEVRKAGGEAARHVATEHLAHVITEKLRERAERVHQPAPHQWFYAKDGQSIGPVSEQQLVELLENNTLPWNTLVWYRALKDWKPASETDLVKPVAPPPLPTEAPKAPPPPPVFSACGQTNQPGDRFCSQCGQPLTRDK